MVLKLSTVEEFTISSVKLFHLSIALMLNEFILNDFKTLGFFSPTGNCHNHSKFNYAMAGNGKVQTSIDTAQKGVDKLKKACVTLFIKNQTSTIQ